MVLASGVVYNAVWNEAEFIATTATNKHMLCIYA